MILSLLDTPAYGGAEEYLLIVLFHLQNKGHRVVLATNNAQVKARCAKKINVIDLPYRLDAIGNWRGLIKYFLALPSAILWLIGTIYSFELPVICLFPGYTDRLSFSPIVKWLGCKLIWLEYGPLEPTFARNHGFPKLLYAIGRSFPDKVVTISEWTKKSLVNVGYIPNEKIQIIFPGVVFPAKAGIQTKQKNSKFTVITVARLAKEKEIDLLLYAWQKIDRAGKRLQIIGDGPERAYLERLTSDLQIADSVSFFGFVSDEKKRRLLSAADLFVFPSAWELEGFGMTTVEAMAVGLPIVTTGRGPQSEIAIDGKNGWYFQPHDAYDLSEKILIAIHTPKRKGFGVESRKMAKEKFLIENTLSEWEKVILSV